MFQMHQGIAPHQLVSQGRAIPSQDRDVGMQSHLLAYEALVGTLTKQVLAQQEQLSELRTLLHQQHDFEARTNTSMAHIPTVQDTSRNDFPPLLHSVSEGGSSPDLHRSYEAGEVLRSKELVDSPPFNDGFGHRIRPSAERLVMTREALESAMMDVFQRQANKMEQQIADALAERVSSITREHVLRSVDKEIRRCLRDVVIEGEASRTHVAHRDHITDKRPLVAAAHAQRQPNAFHDAAQDSRRAESMSSSSSSPDLSTLHFAGAQRAQHQHLAHLRTTIEHYPSSDVNRSISRGSHKSHQASLKPARLSRYRTEERSAPRTTLDRDIETLIQKFHALCEK